MIDMTNLRMLGGGHDHGDETPMTDEEKNVLTLKIVVMILVSIFACFCFLPYMKCIKDRKSKKAEDAGDYNQGKFICCGGGRI